MIKKIFLFLIAVLILINFIYGLGVSPGIVNIDFKPNLTMSFDMIVINNPPKDIDAEIYVSLGINKTIVEEFRNIVSLEKTSLSFTKTEAEKKVKVDLKFPEGFSQGGTYRIGVGAVPAIKEGGGFGIRAGNEITIFVNVPNEYVSEKYKIIKKLKILKIDAESVKQGEKAEINILIKSESQILLKEVYGKIKILKNGVELKTIQTDKIDIASGEEKVLKAFLETYDIPSGNSNLNTEVFYGDDSAKGQGTLNILGPEIEGGFNVGNKKISWTIIFIVIFFIFFILIILLLLFLLLRRKKNESQGQMRVQQTNN
jgi:hypothetical protein